MDQNKIRSEYGELEFEGLKFFEDRSIYSWKTQEEYEAICNSLVEDGSELSRIRYQNMVNSIYRQEIHVRLSRNFLMQYLAYFLMIISFLGAAYQAPIFGSITLVLSVVSYLLHKYFLRKVRESYMGYKMSGDFLELLFDSNYNK